MIDCVYHRGATKSTVSSGFHQKISVYLSITFVEFFVPLLASSRKMSEAATKKRKYLDGGGGKNNRRKWALTNSRPKRGAPGVLLTCETGRERKCEREGLEILDYYLTSSNIATSLSDDCDQDDKEEEEDDKTTTLSLEEELKLLKSKKGPSKSSAFKVYQTSCRGTIFVLCTLSNCNLIPTIQTEYMLSKKNTTSEHLKIGSPIGNDDGDLSNKKLKSETVTVETDKTHGAPSIDLATHQRNDVATPFVQKTPWDPISTVRTIMSDTGNDSNKAAPRSRFVTRMIPIQATCFASSEELQLTCLEVIKRYVFKTTKTFAIVFKRRNCSNLNRKLVIRIVGDIMFQYFPHCKVHLDKPETTIMIEVCGTLCGISVVENFRDHRNFNLMVATTDPGQK